MVWKPPRTLFGSCGGDSVGGYAVVGGFAGRVGMALRHPHTLPDGQGNLVVGGLVGDGGAGCDGKRDPSLLRLCVDHWWGQLQECGKQEQRQEQAQLDQEQQHGILQNPLALSAVQDGSLH